MRTNDVSNPKYVRIARELQEDISTQYAIGDYLPSVRSLSGYFGVTVNTIRMALDILSKKGIVRTLPYRGSVVISHDIYPSSNVLAQFDSAPWNLVPHQKNSPMKESKTVALVMPLSPLFLSILARAVERELRHYGYRLQLCSADMPEDNVNDASKKRQHERNILESLSKDDLAGVIWWNMTTDHNHDLIDKLQRSGTPLLMIGNSPSNQYCDSLGFDQFTAAYQVTKYLMEIVKGDILFLSLKNNDAISTINGDRLLGFLDAESQMDYAEVPPPPDTPLPLSLEGMTEIEIRESIPAGIQRRVFFIEDRLNPTFLDEILQDMEMPASMIVSSDRIAERLLIELELRGLRVPEDILIVSFDDEMHSSAMHTRLNLIQPQYDIMGQRAVHVLLKRRQDSGSGLRQIYLPMKFIPQGTKEQSTSQDVAYLMHE